MKKIITLLAVAIVINSSMVFAQAGKLDSTFGIKGMVKKSYSAYGDYIQDMAIQPDGKTIIAGYTRTDTSTKKQSCFMARYTLSGALDTAFGNKGVMLLTIGASTLTSITLQGDGKILAIGNIRQSGKNYMGVYRFNANGKLDTTFNHTGVDSILNIIPGNIRVAASGNIYIGSQSPLNFCIIKYLSNGTIDNSYATSGYAYFPVTLTGAFLHDTTVGSTQQITIQSHERVLYPLKATKDMAVLRFDSTGHLDVTFGNNGLARINLNKWEDYGNTCVVQSDGKIIVSGYSSDFGGIAVRLAMARFNSNGSIDTAFGSKGKVRNSIMTYSSVPTPVALQTDGKIILATTIQDTATTLGVAYGLTRYNANGKIDTTFGKKGIDSTRLAPNCYLATMMISPLSQKIELTGTARDVSSTLLPYSVTLRYFPTVISAGILDFAKNNNTLLVFPNPVHNNVVINYNLTNDETLNMEIFDIQGRIVKSLLNTSNEPAGDHKLTVNMQELSTGNYIVLMTNSAGQHVSLKIVKN